MQNLDLKKDKIIDEVAIEKMKTALKDGDVDSFTETQIAMCQSVAEKTLEMVKGLKISEINDTEVMKARGFNVLTTTEKAYYNEVIEKAGFNEVTTLMPPTVFERVFEHLKENHELLKHINFQNTTATTEFIIRDTECQSAKWGKLTDEFKKQLEHSFSKVQTQMYKLAAFIIIPKSMLDLGPIWLDRFARDVLAESVFMGIEEAIIKGTGNEEPIGMIKDLDGAVVGGVYPDKKAVELKDLTPASMCDKIMKPLTLTGKRQVNEVMIIVNPLDYWSKIKPSILFKNALGTYTENLPINAKFIQSSAMPEGKMVAGLPDDYFMGVGSNQKIEYSDETKFIEDERVYVTKIYGCGRPIKNDRFIYLDISKMVVPVA